MVRNAQMVPLLDGYSDTVAVCRSCQGHAPFRQTPQEQLHLQATPGVALRLHGPKLLALSEGAKL